MERVEFTVSPEDVELSIIVPEDLYLKNLHVFREDHTTELCNSAISLYILLLCAY